MANNPGPRFTISRSWGIIVLSIFLIFTGLIALLHLSMESLPVIMGIMAILAGVLLLFGA